MSKNTPLKAIRLKCLDCSNNSPCEVRLCPIKNCPLYLYRFGKNPSLMGSKQSKTGAKNLKKYNEIKQKNQFKESH